MSAVVTVRQQVRDYAAWRKVYDEGESLPVQHGCTAQRVMRLPDGGSEVFVILDFPAAEQAGSFAQDRPCARMDQGGG